jgi:hypothetical protein
MKRANFFSPRFALFLLPLVLCMSPGSVGAEEELLWPLDTKLMVKDWVIDAPDAWVDVGDVSLWNTRDHLKIQIVPHDTLWIEEVAIHVVQDPADFDAVLGKDGMPKPSRFDYKTDYLDDEYPSVVNSHLEEIPLSNFEICWGVNPERCPPNLYIIVHVELMKQTEEVIDEVLQEVWVTLPEAAYAENGGVFDRFDKDEGIIWGWYVTYPLAKVEPGHFIDANVNGLTYVTPTQAGVTGQEGQFWFIPQERVALSVGSLSLGDVLGDRRVSPVDLFEGADLDDDRVLNVARLLQSFDADGNPGQGAINITEPVIDCLDAALVDFDPMPPEEFFADDDLVGALIDATIAACAGVVELTAVTKEEALENLNSGMKAGNLMKRNISKTPGMKSDKAKIEIVPVYVPALHSDGSPTEVVYHDADGNVIETRGVAKPIVVT